MVCEPSSCTSKNPSAQRRPEHAARERRRTVRQDEGPRREIRRRARLDALPRHALFLERRDRVFFARRAQAVGPRHVIVVPRRSSPTLIASPHPRRIRARTSPPFARVSNTARSPPPRRRRPPSTTCRSSTAYSRPPNHASPSSDTGLSQRLHARRRPTHGTALSTPVTQNQSLGLVVVAERSERGARARSSRLRAESQPPHLRSQNHRRDRASLVVRDRVRETRSQSFRRTLPASAFRARIARVARSARSRTTTHRMSSVAAAAVPRVVRATRPRPRERETPARGSSSSSSSSRRVARASPPRSCSERALRDAICRRARKTVTRGRRSSRARAPSSSPRAPTRRARRSRRGIAERRRPNSTRCASRLSMSTARTPRHRRRSSGSRWVIETPRVSSPRSARGNTLGAVGTHVRANVVRVGAVGVRAKTNGTAGRGATRATAFDDRFRRRSLIGSSCVYVFEPRSSVARHIANALHAWRREGARAGEDGVRISPASCHLESALDECSRYYAGNFFDCDGWRGTAWRRSPNDLRGVSGRVDHDEWEVELLVDAVSEIPARAPAVTELESDSKEALDALNAAMETHLKTSDLLPLRSVRKYSMMTRSRRAKRP